jgi:hypothetical protein
LALNFYFEQAARVCKQVAAQGTLFSTLSKRLNNWVFGILGEDGKASEKPKALRVLNECLKALPTLSHPKVCRPITKSAALSKTELSLQVLQCVKDTLMLDPSNAYTRAAAIETLGCGLIVKLLDGDGNKQVQRQGSFDECCNIFRF